MALRDRVLDSLVALAGIPLFAPDQPLLRGRPGPTPLTVSSVAAPDAAFAIEAAEHGLAEVSVAELALERAQRDELRDFARRMVADHGAMNAELTRLAVAKRVTLPLSQSAGDQAERARLADLPPDLFDSAYAARAVADHQRAAALFERQRDEGKDVELTAFATRTLPTLREHLNAARSLVPEETVKSRKKRGKKAPGA